MLLAVRAILLALLLAMLLSSLLVPVSDWLRRRGARPALAALGGVLMLVAVGVGATVFVTRSMVTQWTEISADIGEGVERLTADGGDALGLDAQQAADLDNEISDLSASVSDVLLTGVLHVVPVVVDRATTVALALFILFFLLKDGRAMWAWALQRLPIEHRLAGELGLASWRVLAAYLRGMAVVAAVDALAIGLGLLLLDVPFVGAIVVVTYFAAFIPTVGAVLAGAVAVFIALADSGWDKVLATLALVLLVQQIEQHMDAPYYALYVGEKLWTVMPAGGPRPAARGHVRGLPAAPGTGRVQPAGARRSAPASGRPTPRQLTERGVLACPLIR